MSQLIWLIHRFGCVRFLLELLSTKENSPEEKNWFLLIVQKNQDIVSG